MNPEGEKRVRTAADESTRGCQSTVVHVAVVSGIDGVAFLFAAHSTESLRTQVVRYVREQSRTKLQQEETQRIVELLAKGCEEEGIKLYFERASGRWDPECLHRQIVRVDPG